MQAHLHSHKLKLNQIKKRKNKAERRKLLEFVVIAKTDILKMLIHLETNIYKQYYFLK